MSATLVPRPKSSPPVYTYAALRNQVRQIFIEGRKRAIEAVKTESVQTSWEAGKRIEEHVRLNQPTPAGRAAYGKGIVKKLAKDLGKNPTYLYDSWELARTYPNFVPARNLALSHYRKLLAVDDSALRDALAKRAAKKGWGKRELADEIRRIKSARTKEKTAAQKFIPKRGRLDTYQIVARPGTAGLSLDLGFRNYVELPPALARNFKEGDIVEAKLTFPELQMEMSSPNVFIGDPDNKVGKKIWIPAFAGMTAVKQLPNATKKDLFAYRAHIAKVIDADTFWMKIDVALPVWREDKLRLRGVDAPELKTEAGEKAKKFVEEMFAKYPKIEITTTKPDKYDRYLSDVWISSDGTDWLNLNQLLLQKGFARLKTKWSWEDWEK